MDKKIIIAVDGHSGCGKSSTAKVVAKTLGYIYIDTGAMYRAATLYFLQHQVDLTDGGAVEKALDEIDITFRLNKTSGNNETYLNQQNVEEDIRGLAVSEKVSEVSAISAVRKKMVALQRKMGDEKGVVMDGRDIGTVVFPQAELKIFMTASLEVRAQRRLAELEQKGQAATLPDVMENLEKRDRIDSSRADSPLSQAKDAILIDTSFLAFEDQVKKVVTLAKEKIGAA